MSGNGPDFSRFSDEELAESLASAFQANPLRRWMSENGLSRPRGARKLESARSAVAQDRELVAEYLYRVGAIDVDWDRRCNYYEACGNTTPGHGNEICDDCMDLKRNNSYAANPLDPTDFDSMLAFMKELHRRS